MRYCFDIDGTLCYTPNNQKGKPDYLNAKPYPFMVEQVNRLYNEGNYIIFQTARGKGSGIDHTELTKNQLAEWGYKYHELFPMFCKPTADIFIDDKAVNAVEWAASQPKVKVLLLGHLILFILDILECLGSVGNIVIILLLLFMKIHL
jgi:uncharacterized HAD superfamily protein